MPDLDRDGQSMEQAGESKTEEAPEDGAKEEKESDISEEYGTMKVDTETQYQTMESFGTSGAWWSQYVGAGKEPLGLAF